MTVQLAKTWARDYVVDGVPSTGVNKPSKADIRGWGTWVEGIINAFTSNGGLIYSSLAALNADLAHDANTSAWIYGDASAANDGIYQKIGASGSGSWSRIADLPYSFIIASNVGAGTANAIVATTDIPLPAADGKALISVPIFTDTTGAPVTVAFNGGSALTIKSNSGSDITVGGLAAGMIVAGYISGSTFRLLSDQSSAAILAACEAAQAAAQAAATSVIGPKATLALVQADTPASDPEFYDVAYYDTSYAVNSGGRYRKVGSEPAHNGKVQNGNGTWYELQVKTATPQMFGPIGAPNDDAVVKSACQYATLKLARVLIDQQHALSSIDLTDLTGILRVQLDGVIAHVAGASGAMVNFNGLDSVYISSEGMGVVDGNEVNQTSWLAQCFYFGKLTNLYLKGFRVQNMKYAGINIDAPPVRGVMENMDFQDGAIHSGTIDQYCRFVICRGCVGSFDGTRCRFIQTADPTGTQVRQPCGFNMINTGGTEVEGQFTLDHFYVENLGMNLGSSSNILGAIDFYSIAEQVTVTHLKAKKCRYTPLRICHGRNISVKNNVIDQSVALLLDGGGADQQVAGIAVELIDRGYALDSNDVMSAEITNNTVTVTGTINVIGIYVNAGSATGIFRHATVQGNSVKSSGGTNTYPGISCSAVKSADLAGNTVDGFGTGIRIANTSLSGQAVAGESDCPYNVSGGTIQNCPVGVQATLNVANLDLKLGDHLVIKNASNLSYTIRGARNVHVEDCILPDTTSSAPGDTSANAAFWYQRNHCSYGADPVGYASNTYYRLKDNVGRADQASA